MPLGLVRADPPAESDDQRQPWCGMLDGAGGSGWRAQQLLRDALQKRVPGRWTVLLYQLRKALCNAAMSVDTEVMCVRTEKLLSEFLFQRFQVEEVNIPLRRGGPFENAIEISNISAKSG